MPNTPQAHWENEFDGKLYDYVKAVRRDQTLGEQKEEETEYGVFKNYIKALLTSTQAEERKRVVEVIQKMKSEEELEPKRKDLSESGGNIWRNARSTVLSKLLSTLTPKQ